MQRQRNRIVDTFYLIGAAVLVCILGLGAFLLADIYHVNPLWAFFGLISIGILLGPERITEKNFDHRDSWHSLSGG